MSARELEACCFAAARRHLADARVAQRNAVYFGMRRYHAGRAGRDARLLAKHWDQKRAMWLREALRVRTNIHALRAEVRRLALTLNTKGTADGLSQDA